MVSTPEVFTENSPMTLSQYLTVKNPSVRKSLHQFSEALDVKSKNSVRRLCAAK